MSARLDKSGVPVGESGDVSGGFGLCFFMICAPSLVEGATSHLLSNRCGWQLYAG
ncbi:hypothetical protein D3C71_2248040 [compost metagenome]